MKIQPPGSGAFNLIEVVLALGIASFVLLTLVGLLGTAHNAGADSAKNIEAASVASQVINRWRALTEWNYSRSTPSGAPRAFPLPVTIPNTNASVTGSDLFVDSEGLQVASANEGSFRLSYKVSRPAAFPETLQVFLQLSWPPQAQADKASRYDVVSTALLRE